MTRSPRLRTRALTLLAAAPLALIMLAYASVFIALLPHCRHQINPDGVGYIRLATYWASGHYHDAVNGYWAPLLPWLLIPFARAGADMLWACKVITGLGGLALTCAAWYLYGRFGLSATARGLATAATAAMALDMATAVITPDIIAAALLTFYFGLTVAGPGPRSPVRLLTWGALGGLAYLAKSYALPFVALHFVVMVVLAAFRSGESRPVRVVARSVLWFGLGTAFVAGPWIGALSWKYGRPTFSTTSGIAHAVVAPGNEGAHPFDGFRIPSGEALSYWEDPSLAGLPYTYWSPFDSLQMARHQVKVIKRNLDWMRGALAHAQPDGLFSVALLAALGVALAAGAGTALRHRQVWALGTVACYVSGYALTFGTAERYYWPLFPVLIVLVFQLLEFANTHAGGATCPGPKVRHVGWWVIATLVTLSFMPTDTLMTRHRGTAADPLETLAMQARRDGMTGPVGSSTWRPGLFLCYFANLKFAGMPASSVPDQIVREAQRTGVRTFAVFPGGPRGAASAGSVNLDGVSGAELIGQYKVGEDTDAQPVKLYRILPRADAGGDPAASLAASEPPLPTPGIQ